jgi:2-methylcitrate dehydratase
VELNLDAKKLESTPVDEYVDLYTVESSKFVQ